MNWFELLVIAIGLSMDSFAVSLSAGIPSKGFRHFLKIAVFLAVFQMIMPGLGFLLGLSFKGLIEDWDHWAAFSLLTIIGIKMIVEALSSHPEKENLDFRALPVLIGISVATSIDALIVGLGFAFLDVNIFLAVALIGVITLMASLTGGFIGNRLGNYLGNKAEIVGGLILIAIGVKVLIQHNAF